MMRISILTVSLLVIISAPAMAEGPHSSGKFAGMVDVSQLQHVGSRAPRKINIIDDDEKATTNPSAQSTAASPSSTTERAAKMIRHAQKNKGMIDTSQLPKAGFGPHAPLHIQIIDEQPSKQKSDSITIVPEPAKKTQGAVDNLAK